MVEQEGSMRKERRGNFDWYYLLSNKKTKSWNV